MRLWHYEILGVLPTQMLVSQWRECIAIKRQWEKGTLKHRLVSYVLNYDREVFYSYVYQVVRELKFRDIKYQHKYLDEIYEFCYEGINTVFLCNYFEHNNRYLKQCYYNLQEKYDRGIITKEEWGKIDLFYNKKKEN